MSSKNVGIEEARKALGDLVTQAQQGADIVITRNGKPAARIVTAKEYAMPTSYLASRPSDMPAEDPPFAGSFNPHGAHYWVGDGKARAVDVDGEIVYVDREGERLWQTNDGRWIVTQWGDAPAYQIADGEAGQWFAANGYGVDREAFARRLDG